MARQLPSTAVVVGSRRLDGELSYVAIVDGRVWVRMITCGRCRRVMGWSFVGDLAAMTDRQLRELQRTLGIGDDVSPLRTVEAWRAQKLPLTGGGRATSSPETGTDHSR